MTQNKKLVKQSQHSSSVVDMQVECFVLSSLAAQTLVVKQFVAHTLFHAVAPGFVQNFQGRFSHHLFVVGSGFRITPVSSSSFLPSSLLLLLLLLSEASA
jgi:hypothetical protein